MEKNTCILCDLSDDTNLREVKPRGIQTLTESSKQRCDKKYYNFENLPSVFVHKSCQAKYNDPKAIKLYKTEFSQKVTEGKRRSKEAREFNFETHCFFCGEMCYSFRKEVCTVSSASTKENIIKEINKRKDSNDKDLLSRLSCTANILNGKYHKSCMANFYLKNCSNRNVENTKNILDFLVQYIQNNEGDCQFSFNEIREKFEGSIAVRPTCDSIKNHLNAVFPNRFICKPVKNDLLIKDIKSIDTSVWDSWFAEKNKKAVERKRIVEMAAKIILEDISKVDYDTEKYVLLDAECRENWFKDIPPSLISFFDIVIKTGKTKTDSSEEKWSKRVATLSHCLIAAVRPRSFLSPILQGFSSFIHKTFGARDVIDAFSFAGICSSYKETLRFEASVLKDPENNKTTDSAYVQYVYDNADHNTSTVDGKNTFHAMGGGKIVTPKSSVTLKKTIPRLRKIPNAEDLAKRGFIKLQRWEKQKSEGLKGVEIKKILENDNDDDFIDTPMEDFLWFYSKFSSDKTPGWNGFMEQAHINDEYQTSEMMFLPFVNNPPTSFDTILTVMAESARDNFEYHKQKFIFITFDQQLYVKAWEILASVDRNNDPLHLASIKLRLGGFHTLMSFLGSVGFIMDGSGLKEALCTIYASNSVDKMLTGHAYARAIRGHFLVHLALSTTVFSSLDLTDTDKGKLDSILQTVGTDNFLECLTEKELIIIKDKFNKELHRIKNLGPTSKLFVRYMQMIQIIKDFIRAERSGNFELHLKCIEHMIPYFHSSGHNNYSKSAHLYLQDMRTLKTEMSEYEYELFVAQGYFTIRRSHKFWSGVWSDMTIEQVLMRTMKTRGGLTHGRGFSDSVLIKFVATMIFLVSVCNQVENFCNVRSYSSEQHVDSRESRISRDVADVQKILNFFSLYHPFPETEKIMSIYSGVVGGSTINCHNAFEVGMQHLKSIIGLHFGSVKLPRKNKVLSLKTVNSSVRVNDETVAIDPLLLFQRISLNIMNQEDMKIFLQHELAPFPLSLFTENGFRKNIKSHFYKEFTSTPSLPDSDETVTVVDGGFLLHKAVWEKNDTVENITNTYLQYVQSHYGENTHIVFDGYPDAEETETPTAEKHSSSTKGIERLRRKNVSVVPNLEFDDNTKIPYSQEKFLSNESNKNKLIKKIISKFNVSNLNLQCQQAEEDADRLIVLTAITTAKHKNMISPLKTVKVVIIGQDIDLLVLLCQLNTENCNIFFCKVGAGNVEDMYFDSNSYLHEKRFVAFVHCFSGCDTTSAFAGKGKITAVKSLVSNKNFMELANVFYDTNANPDVIAGNGCKLVASLYGKKPNVSLNELRYLNYQSLQVKSTFKLEKLPPTEGAAKQHSFRTYCQLQSWLGNKKNAVSWGWKHNINGIVPTYTEEKLIPDELLKKVCCSCAKGCGTLQCGCRKHGLQCTNLCTKCDCESCSNFEQIAAEDSEEVESEETTRDDSSDCRENFNEFEESVGFYQSDEEEQLSGTDDEPELEPPNKKQKL